MGTIEGESGELVNDARENGRSVSPICRDDGLQGVSSSKAKKRENVSDLAVQSVNQ